MLPLHRHSYPTTSVSTPAAICIPDYTVTIYTTTTASNTQSGNMSLNHTQTPNSSVTKIHQTRSPVLPNTREQRQQQEQGQEQQYAQLKQEFFSSKRKRNSRRKHRNSHLGCGTCKKRRIKCDETLPSCLNCIKGKLHCAYLNLDNQARNALRLAQYNQSMRQERLREAKLLMHNNNSNSWFPLVLCLLNNKHKMVQFLHR